MYTLRVWVSKNSEPPFATQRWTQQVKGVLGYSVAVGEGKRENSFVVLIKYKYALFLLKKCSLEVLWNILREGKPRLTLKKPKVCSPPCVRAHGALLGRTSTAGSPRHPLVAPGCLLPAVLPTHRDMRGQ